MQHEKNAPLNYDVARAIILEMETEDHGPIEGHWARHVQKIKSMLGNYAFVDYMDDVTQIHTNITVVDTPAGAPANTFISVAPVIGNIPEMERVEASYYMSGRADEVEGEPDLEAIAHVCHYDLLRILKRWVQDDEGCETGW